MFSQLLKIVEEILEWVRSTKKAALSVDPMGIYDNSCIKQLLHIQDKYLKKLHDDGYLAICVKATSTGIEVVTSSPCSTITASRPSLPRRICLKRK
ncbi:MAG: hypothetical protein IJS20_10350 [Bacteroidales bacterium]|nr:hypothetical protein [Bacteroidales bacterium]